MIRSVAVGEAGKRKEILAGILLHQGTQARLVESESSVSISWDKWVVESEGRVPVIGKPSITIRNLAQ
jgi:hypothetical protein